MKPFHLKYQLKEGRDYQDCQDTVSHPIVVEAFRFGDANGKEYDCLEWDGEIYQAEYVKYMTPNGEIDGEVFVGEWLGSLEKGAISEEVFNKGLPEDYKKRLEGLHEKNS